MALCYSNECFNQDEISLMILWIQLTNMQRTSHERENKKKAFAFFVSFFSR